MIKNFFRTLPTEAFSRPAVEKLSNSIYIFLNPDRQRNRMDKCAACKKVNPQNADAARRYGLRQDVYIHGERHSPTNSTARRLVLAHNKTLAAQLCSEFREFFPENAVEYFVSYYDYYQPEAYIPRRRTRI
jgi:hypothetical protein